MIFCWFEEFACRFGQTEPCLNFTKPGPIYPNLAERDCVISCLFLCTEVQLTFHLMDLLLRAQESWLKRRFPRRTSACYLLPASRLHKLDDLCASGYRIPAFASLRSIIRRREKDYGKARLIGCRGRFIFRRTRSPKSVIKPRPRL